MSRDIKPVHEFQYELLNYFSLNEVGTIHKQFKDIFMMATVETSTNIGNNEKSALFNLYQLIEIPKKGISKSVFSLERH